MQILKRAEIKFDFLQMSFLTSFSRKVYMNYLLSLGNDFSKIYEKIFFAFRNISYFIYLWYAATLGHAETKTL